MIYALAVILILQSFILGILLAYIITRAKMDFETNQVVRSLEKTVKHMHSNLVPLISERRS